MKTNETESGDVGDRGCRLDMGDQGRLLGFLGRGPSEEREEYGGTPSWAKRRARIGGEGLCRLWPLYSWQRVRSDMGAGYPVKKLNFTIKPFPLPLKGKIP